ncbi:MAG: hypothetical protein Q9161_002239 [Pseudevernia consocians]
MPDADLPDKKLPVTKFILRHPEGNEARTCPCVHFITFGRDYGKTKVLFPTVLTLDLCEYEPPPPHLCEKFTGLDDEIVDSFFSIPANESKFHEALAELRETIKLRSQRGCVAYVINCTAGMHRSVSMARRLAREVRKVDGFKTECLHLDLAKGIDAQAKKAAKPRGTEMSENTPARGRSRLRHKTHKTTGAQVNQERPRASADAVLPAIEAPPREKPLSWGTTLPIGALHPQQSEIAGRSAGPWEKVESRRRRLSS